jgi:uncharacterized protein with HEPN domain
MSPDLMYLEDIRDAADRAVIHITGLEADILRDNPFLQDGVVRCLILLGEAARQVSPATRALFPHFDWSGMVGLRNVLVHRYREVDFLELWTIVNRDLPPIAEELSRYLRGFE